MSDLNTSQFLIEMDTYDDTDGVVVERFATGKGFRTSPSETPALAKYVPKVINAGNIQRTLYGSAKTSGLAPLTTQGGVIFNNADSALDYLGYRGLDGRTITIRERTGDAYPADMPIRFRGTMPSIGEYTDRQFRVDVASQIQKTYEQEFQTELYAGTNNGTTQFLEGTATTIKNTQKPRLIGDLSQNFEPIIVDEPNLIYQISSDEVAQIVNVYVGRAVITAGTRHNTLAAFITAATTGVVTAGTYDYYLGDNSSAIGTQARGCYFAFGTSPNKKVTCDARAGVKNLVLYSEDFSNAAWVAALNSTITASGALAPDGTFTAGAYTTGPSVSTETLSQNIGTPLNALGKFQCSAYLEKTTANYVMLYLQDGSGNYAGMIFDISTGVVGTSVSSGSVIQYVSASIETAPNGYYLCTVIVNAATTPSGSVTFRARPTVTSSSTSVQASVAFNIWGAHVYDSGVKEPYVKTTSATAWNSTTANIIYRLLTEQGVALDHASRLIFNKDVPYLLQHFQSNDGGSVQEIVTLLVDSVRAYLIDDTTGTMFIGRITVPEVSQREVTIDNRYLLNSATGAKIKYLSSNDDAKGVPVFQYNIGYSENYTIMNDTDLAGIALSELPFLKEAFRYEVFGVPAVRTKHLTSTEQTKDTKIVAAADALLQATYEQGIDGTIRRVIEIRVPLSIGFSLDLGDVIRVKERLYRIIGVFLKFPSSGREVTTQAITLQAWGGIVDTTDPDIFELISEAGETLLSEDNDTLIPE